MAAVSFGSIREFGFETEDITEWLERLDQWFIANGLEEDNAKRRAILLSNIGARGYKLLRCLSQNKPQEKTYAQLKELLLEHINPPPNVISQRFLFHRRERRTGETVKTYVAELRKLSEHCNFGERLEEDLRDKFVSGLGDPVVQQKLLAIKDLTFKVAVETAVAMEAAVINARQIHGVGLEGRVHRLGGHYIPGESKNRNSGSAVGKYTVGQYIGRNGNHNGNQKGKECFRCGSQRHLADKCPFKDKECFGCKQKGHAKRKCRRSNGGGGATGGRERVHLIEEVEELPPGEDDLLFEDFEDLEIEEGLHCLNLYKLGEDEQTRNDPMMLEVLLNDTKVSMEVDTGAAVSVMSQ